MEGVRGFQDILADIRGECVAGIAAVQLVKRGTYSESQAFIKVVRSLNKIIEFVVEGEKLLTVEGSNSKT